MGYPEKGRLEVTLLGAPANPKTEGYDWTKALVQVEVGAFKGEVEIHVCVNDMISLKEQLEPVYKNLIGVAEFRTIEGQLDVRVEADRLGHVSIPALDIEGVSRSFDSQWITLLTFIR
jgi:hypothetical protein